jgi:hypothetical protein
MLLIEFDENINCSDLNILKYRGVENEDWYYLYVDLATLNLLISNFGMVGAKRYDRGTIQLDNGTDNEHIDVKYCGSDITLRCFNSRPFMSKETIKAYNAMEQRY